MQKKMADQSFSLASRIKLNNGLTMPQLHLGVYLMSGSEASKAVSHALDAGYRGFDSAQVGSAAYEPSLRCEIHDECFLKFLLTHSSHWARCTTTKSRSDMRY